MADRGIIFSAPMVRALVWGLKTQTRRLADSPLRLSEQGDRLWVRETWAKAPPYGVRYPATDSVSELRKMHPSIHMPRWASRLTLLVTDVRVQRLQDISREDAIAEGLIHKTGVIEPDWWMLPRPLHQGSFLSPVAAFSWLWNSLHTDPGKRWEDNPEIVALTFEVRHGNIDELGDTHV